MRAVSPFLRGNVWWARVPRLAAPPIQRSLGVEGKDNRDVAVAVCAFLTWLRGRRESFLLDALAMGKANVGQAYTAYVENRLDAFVTELREGVQDVNVEPFVAKWQRELERRKKPNAQSRKKYLRQVRTLIPEGQPFPRSKFTKQAIRAWLSGLEVGQPNRYRAALSSLAEYLVFEDVIASNIVRQVPMAAERDPRTAHLSPEDAAVLVKSMPADQRALHAAMIATGIELGAALALLRRDIETDQVYARGTKRRHRQRTCTIYHRWAGFWAEHVEPWLADRKLLPAAPVFPAIKPWTAYRALKSALSATKLDEAYPDYRVHDHRHTWAVQAVRDGLALHTIAHQLGHRDATMVLKVYGRYVPTAADFHRNATSSATPTVTESRA